MMQEMRATMERSRGRIISERQTDEENDKQMIKTFHL